MTSVLNPNKINWIFGYFPSSSVAPCVWVRGGLPLSARTAYFGQNLEKRVSPFTRSPCVLPLELHVFWGRLFDLASVPIRSCNSTVTCALVLNSLPFTTFFFLRMRDVCLLTHDRARQIVTAVPKTFSDNFLRQFQVFVCLLKKKKKGNAKSVSTKINPMQAVSMIMSKN